MTRVCCCHVKVKLKVMNYDAWTGNIVIALMKYFENSEYLEEWVVT